MSRREAGFTIVETLIVLAIGGLILLIVFLAVPNLQRSGRNNQRRQDIQAILQAVSHYELNNSGNIPSTAQLRSFLTSYYKDKMTFYAPTDVTVCPTAPVVNPPYCAASDSTIQYTNQSTLDTVIIDNHGKCAGVGDYTNQGAGYSDVVALYSLEAANGKTSQCQEL